MKPQQRLYSRAVASSAAAFLIIYCTGVLFYVSTSADLGIRCLLTNDRTDLVGVQVRQVNLRAVGGLPGHFGTSPEPGDLIVRIGNREIHTFADFADSLADLRAEFRRASTYGSRVEGANPLDIDRYASLPPVIEYYAPSGGRASEEPAAQAKDSSAQGVAVPGREGQSGRYVRVEYLPSAGGEPRKVWLRIQTLPVLEVILSILWCLLELGIFAVAALSLCHRPSDRAARLFFALSLVTLPAFVGAYHWWVIAANPFLTGPYVICAILLPVVTLHFYLNYPARHWLRVRGGLLLLGFLYSLPVLMIVSLTFLLSTSYSARYVAGLSGFQPLLLYWVRQAVDIYIVVSLGYFAASVYCMFDNYRNCQQISERKQMQWILVAALAATPLVLYAVYLSFADRVGLALGRGRIPMVIVSLLFMTAYAIGILRYRLMLLEQMVSRHTLYLALSQLVTLMYSVLIAVGSLLTVYRGLSVPEQLVPLFLIFIVMIFALGWLRDKAQQMLDRQFFREKYRLDRAMQQMNLVVAQVADVRTLADHMLRSCREVLQLRFSALYLRDGRSPQFDLVCAVGGRNLPPRLQLDEDSESLLKQSGSCQRILGALKGNAPLLQQLHRQLNSQLMHGFEVDGRVTGLVVLGAKSSSLPFTAEDTTFVTAIGQMTGVALQCVRVQQNVSRMDGILQEKIRKIESQERQIAILRNQLSEGRELAREPQLAAEVKSFDLGLIRGRSRALAQVLNSARKVAGSDSSVLIRGESGTGKELLATALHRNSKRGEGPLISVNCAALSPALLESELFGHVKGAFTGAYRDTAGRFQLADGGTLFLDEIGDVSPDMQVKLLRVLQERKFEPVGGRESISVDVRLIAATHQNLEQLMREGKFREDLYYRLNVITLQLPPLRERKEDIFDLALTFLNDAAEKAGKSIRDIDDLAFRALMNYHWPGNIRELHNAIQRAVVLAESDCLQLENLPLEVQRAEFTDFHESADNSFTAGTAERSVRKLARPAGRQTRESHENQEAHEQQWLADALQKCEGNKAQAARLLGLPRSTFYSKLKKYNL